MDLRSRSTGLVPSRPSPARLRSRRSAKLKPADPLPAPRPSLVLPSAAVADGSGALTRPIITPAPSARARPPALQIHWDFFGFIVRRGKLRKRPMFQANVVFDRFFNG